jgi:cellulose synthase/poly-beta-1,6-N-acetylglucosamine synthase-like glycosyltransferase
MLVSFVSISYPKPFLVGSLYGLTFFYIMWGIYHIIIVSAGDRMPATTVDRHHGAISGPLPKISIIIPARNEPILSRTIEACLHHTDYPPEKKEIVVVVDDPDGERIAFWYQQRYPQNVKLLSRRKLYPTKPSALNDSIHLCSGEIIGIMDVEDIPDRDVFLRQRLLLKMRTLSLLKQS